MVARRITRPQRNILGSNLTGCSFFQVFFRGGGGAVCFYDSLHGFFFFLFILSLFFFSFHIV